MTEPTDPRSEIWQAVRAGRFASRTRWLGNRAIGYGVVLCTLSIIGAVAAAVAAPAVGGLIWPGQSDFVQLTGMYTILGPLNFWLGLCGGIGIMLLMSGVADRRRISRSSLRCPNCRYLINESRKSVADRSVHTCPECGLTFTEGEYAEFLRLMASKR